MVQFTGTRSVNLMSLYNIMVHFTADMVHSIPPGGIVRDTKYLMVH